MELATVVVALLGAFFAAVMNRSFFNPVSLALVIFACVSFLPGLHLYGLYDFPSVAYGIVLTGCVSILGGALVAFALSGANTRASRDLPSARTRPETQVSYRLASWAAIVAIATLIVTRVSILAILFGGGGFAAVRNYFLGYGGSSGYTDTLDELAGRLVVSPIMFALTPIFIFSLIVGPLHRRFSVLFLSAVALNLFTTGGRIIFLYAVVQLVVLYAMHRRSQVKFSRRQIGFAAIASMALVLAVTLSRGNAVLYEAYTYFAIPLPLLGHWVEWVDAQQISTDGYAFNYGIVTLVANVADLFGISVAEPISYAVALPQERWVELLPGRPFNAFVTTFFYFYLDFRMYGVVIFSFLAGYVVQRIYSNARTERGAWPTLLLLLVLQGVVVCFVRWQPTDGAYVLSFVLLWLLTRRRSLSERDRRTGSSNRDLDPVRA